MGWKTIAGGVIGVGAWLFQQPQIDPLTIAQSVGMILTVIGGRHAIAKAAKG